jgi:hypothetical protein
MKNIITIFTLLIIGTGVLSAQTIQCSDFNKDGVLDTLKYKNGNIEYIDGFTNQLFSFDLIDNPEYSNFLSFIAIPNELAHNQNLLDSVQRFLFHSPEISFPQPGLGWLLSAYENIDFDIDTSYYSKIFRVHIQWFEWPPKFPGAEYMFVNTDTMSIPQLHYTEEKKYNYGWLTYYGHNHRQYIDNQFLHEFTRIHNAQDNELYKSSHGIIIRKNDQFCWLFHSNSDLTGGPSKLRWPSIGTVLIYKNHILLNHKSELFESNKLFIINMDNGDVGEVRLEIETDCQICFNMFISQNKLILKPDCCYEYVPDAKIENIIINLDELIEKLKLSPTKK